MTGPYMLDTNTISGLISRRSKSVRDRAQQIGNARIRISSIVYGEIRYGMAKNPASTRFADTAEKFFAEVGILPWTPATAERYGTLRAEMRRIGRALQPLDMLIAAHALDAGAALVTADQAFRFVPGLVTENWLEA